MDAGIGSWRALEAEAAGGLAPTDHRGLGASGGTGAGETHRAGLPGLTGLVGQLGEAAPTGAAETRPPRVAASLALIALVLAVGAVGLVAFGPTPEVRIDGSAAGPVAAAALVDGSSGTVDASGAGGTTAAADTGTLVVDVGGAVLRPGVYRLPAGSRVADALAAAGGFGPRVDAARAGRELNLAARIEDGSAVRVPSRDDPAAAETGTPGGAGTGAAGAGWSAGSTGAGSMAASPGGGPINVNTASAAQLDTLPGVGPATAAKIIAARSEQPFASIDELLARKVVGKATFAKIRDAICIR